jgi:hypothetical protein
MKQCPKCRREYHDHALQVCPEDGRALFEKFGVESPGRSTARDYSGQAPDYRAGFPRTSPPVALRPSNAGLGLAIVAAVLGLAAVGVLISGIVIGSMNQSDPIVDGSIIVSLLSASLGMILGLLALSRTFRAAGALAARITAVFAVVLNLVFLLRWAALMFLYSPKP